MKFIVETVSRDWGKFILEKIEAGRFVLTVTGREGIILYKSEARGHWFWNWRRHK